MSLADLLGPIRHVVQNSDFVAINARAIKKFAEKFTLKNIKINSTRGMVDEIGFWFLADAQAFCFWGYPKKWTINYQGKELDGWWALLATHQRAIEEGKPILDGKYLANLTIDEVREIYRGIPEIPLIKERLKIFKGIGTVLVEKYQGKLANFWQNMPTDALRLVLMIKRVFPEFNDVATYKGQPVAFYKKAQLFVADLARYRHIDGIDQLTGEADYKIPALLRSLGILVYVPRLAKKVDGREELPAGSVMEVEIRANMLWALQLILKELKPRYPDLTASALDRSLWHLSQDKSLIDKPYHLTRTINY